ncbi:MAG: sulfatase-like hydrolase/transferase [Sulfurimonas sp.]|nr:sulfatase-like hydrolase/transferase [Sulfurimonas sp.]
MNLIGNAMFQDSLGYAYYPQFYSETFIFKSTNIESIYLYKTEIYQAKKYISKYENCEFTCEYDSIIPISVINNENNNVLDNEFSIIIKKDNRNILLENTAQNRYHYLQFKKNENISVSSNQDLLIGKPIALKQIEKKKKKLVLNIFIDAFSASLFDKYSYEELLPNTYEFFKKGVIFNKCYSNGESTLPSLSSMFSGKYVKNNNFFHPRKRQIIGLDQKIVSQYFSEEGYFTQLISGNYGQNPYQGYCLGFDRTVFKHSLKHNEIVYEFLDSMRVFKERDSFVWLSFLDIHHSLNITSSFSSGVELDIKNHNYQIQDRVKTPFKGYCPRQTARYIEEIKKIDYHLKSVYDYIESNYSDEEILISLVSDHGNSFTDQTKKMNILRREKLNVPFMIRGTGLEDKVNEDIIENVDILPTLLKYSGIKYDTQAIDGIVPKCFDGATKDVVFSESLHPKQTYKATIKNNEYEAFFETKDYVNQNGEVNLSNYTFELYEIKGDLLVSDENIINKYKQIMLNKVNRG